MGESVSGARRRPLRPGTRVKVYTDPITRTNLEGEATLSRRISQGGPKRFGSQRWWVRFDGFEGFEAERVSRWVHPDDVMSDAGNAS